MKADAHGRTPHFVRICAAVLSVVLALSMVAGAVLLFFYN